MAIDLIPAGVLWGSLWSTPAAALVSKVWIPHDPPKPIGPGELDTITTATNRIYWQWQQGPNWLALETILGTGFAAVIAEQFQVSEYRYLDTGFGSILDELGAAVGLERMGLPEELYRAAIPVRGASLISDAGIDAVMAPVKQLLGAANVTYLPAYPAAFYWVITAAVAPTVLDLLLVLLPPLIGQGIGAALLLSPPESPGWDWTPAEAWAASWGSIYGPVDASVAAPWGWSVPVG
jgi:GNAT superfamily N-acetyltransferase